MPVVINRPRPPMRRPPMVPIAPPTLRTSQGSALHVTGMHGMGDNIHQRALIRHWKQSHTVYLETPWPSIYHDLVGPHLKLVRKATRLRTQAKNLLRESSAYVDLPPYRVRTQRVWYSRDDVVKAGSVFDGMRLNGQCPVRDFSLPVPDSWMQAAARYVRSWSGDKPMMIYRPLVKRTEWSGCDARNPEYDAYYALFQSIRDRFFVVSVADLVPEVEWMVGRLVKADVEFHAGELTFEALAALTKRASLTFASPGFLTILAQAVGTPNVCVFGGYEDGHSFQGGAHLAPHLAIEPVNPCQCFQHRHPCQKAIDIPRAIGRLDDFVGEHVWG